MAPADLLRRRSRAVPSIRPSTNHLKPTGTSSMFLPRPLATRSMMLDETRVLPMPTFSDHSGRWVKKVLKMQTAR